MFSIYGSVQRAELLNAEGLAEDVPGATTGHVRMAQPIALDVRG